MQASAELRAVPNGKRAIVCFVRLLQLAGARERMRKLGRHPDFLPYN
jgi:hypothetical protein